MVQKVDSINEREPVLSDLTSCNWSARISCKSDQYEAWYERTRNFQIPLLDLVDLP